MTRRLGVMALLAVLQAVLAVGCVLTRNERQAAAPPEPQPQGAEAPGDEPRVDQQSAASPYQGAAPQPVPSEPTIRTVSDRAARAAAEEVPPPAEGTEVLPLPPPAPPPIVAELPTLTSPALPRTAEAVVPDPPLIQAVRAYLEQKPSRAGELLDQTRLPNKDLLKILLPLTVRCGREDCNPREQGESLLAQCRDLERVLRSGEPLALEKVCLCRRVETFGVYDPLPLDHGFEAGLDGQPGEQVTVYVEVRSFTTRQRGALHETVLASTIEIHDLEGRLVTRTSFPSVPDRSRSPRKDYHLTFQLHVPPRVPAGRYTLWVQVRDLLAPDGQPRVARRSLDFRVIEPRPEAASRR